MRVALAIILLASASVSKAKDHPRTYLLSIVALPLKAGESLERFSFDTWGAEFKAVCHIPVGWRITTGKSLTGDGELGGWGSHGVTWFNRVNPPELRSFVVVALYGPIQKDDIREGTGVIPATFKGTATISTDSTESEERRASLSSSNIRLIPARKCP